MKILKVILMHTPLFFDDLSVGDFFESLSKTITESEIIDYGWKYDPQPFHVSKPEANKSQFGGLIASGFMTAAITFRLIQQSNGFQTTSAGGHGINKLRWLKPVRPDDTIHAKMRVLSLRPSRSRPTVGNVLCEFETFNQKYSTVMTMENIWILKCRP
jgi:acyl dehydratase